MSNEVQTQQAGQGTIWGDQSGAPQQKQTDYYLNVTLEVKDGLEVQMPLNCPVSLDLPRMSANQKRLMKMLIEKADAAIEQFADPEERKEHLTLTVPVTLTMSRRNMTEADDGEWTI